MNHFNFFLLILFVGFVGIVGFKHDDKNTDKVIEEIKLLESRIARQDTLLQHHIKKAEFDSTNQANQKRVK